MTSSVKSARNSWPWVPWHLLWSVAVAASVALAFYASEFGSPAWEAEVMRFLQGLRIPGLHETDLLLTRMGHTPWAIPLSLFAVVGLLVAGHARLGWFLLALTFGRLVGGLIKLAVDRPRPDAGQVDLAYLFGGPSFPSGHVLGITLLLGWLCYAATHVFSRQSIRLPFQAACVAGMGIMGISRIELGAHWPTDVLGAYLIAGVILAPMMSLHRRISTASARISHPSEGQKSALLEAASR